MFPSSKSSQTLKIKTQKALQVVNHYQVVKNQSFLNKTVLRLTRNIDTFNSYTKQFDVKQVVRLQLLPKSKDVYFIKNSKQLQPKIIFKNIRGGPFDLNVYYDKQSLLRKLNTHKFIIKDQIIVKLDSKKLIDCKQIYYQLINGNNLTMCNFRMDLVGRKKIRKGLKTQRSQQTLITILEQIKHIRQKSPKNNEIKSKSLKKSTINFFHQQDLQILKPQNRKKQLQRQKQLQEQRKLAMIQRKQKAQIFKQKQNQAKKVVTKCKLLVHNYQQIIKQQTRLKSLMIKHNSPIYPAIKFALLSTFITNERQTKMNRIFMIQQFRNRFERKLKKAYRQTIQMVPQSSIRQKTVVQLSLIFLGKSLYLKNYKKSSNIISQVTLNTLSGIILNNVMNASNKYRRYVRLVQKIWKTKYSARTQLLLLYTDRQLISIFKRFPQFRVLHDYFKNDKIAQSICYQYQVDTALKIKQLFINYQKKLQQIQQFKKINQQIKKYNQSAITKKRVRQLLQIPKKPTSPQHRFFRDLMVLKNMLRSWFEVEYRRWKKKNKSKAKIQSRLQQTKR